MRKDLNMRKGKMVAQGAHASLKVFLDNDLSMKLAEWRELDFSDPSLEPVDLWVEGSFTKICVAATSEFELFQMFNAAKRKGIWTSLIEDSGRTEFNGVPTPTCCAIGPWWSDEIDEITGKLELL